MLSVSQHCRIYRDDDDDGYDNDDACDADAQSPDDVLPHQRSRHRSCYHHHQTERDYTAASMMTAAKNSHHHRPAANSPTSDHIHCHFRLCKIQDKM